jgi:phage/plasmid-like protein (TIGR03299 family)
MSHDIEITADGKAQFVGAREPAWHRLGTIFEDQDGITVSKVLETLDCGRIETVPVFGEYVALDAEGAETVRVPDPTRKMTVRVRESGITPLGVVKQAYQVVDEAQAFAFIDNIVDADEAIVSSAGLLDGGRRAFCCLKLPTNVLVGGVDAVDMYLFIVTSHDGSLATTGAVTPIRVVCQNTVTAGLRAAVSGFKIRHTSNALGRIAQAREALEISYATVDEWQAEVENLVNVKVDKKKYEAMVKVMFPAPAKDAAKQALTAHENTWETLMGLWGADTQSDIKNTAWGAYNAFVEYGDWFRGTRGADDALAQQFLTSLTSGHGSVRALADYKDRALQVVKAKAGLTK